MTTPRTPGIIRLLDLDADRRARIEKYKRLFALMAYEVRVKIP